MKGYDPAGELGPKKPLPDAVTIIEPKEEQAIHPHSENKGQAAQPINAPASAQQQQQQQEVPATGAVEAQQYGADATAMSEPGPQAVQSEW